LITDPSADMMHDKADSLYTIVILAARRARNLNLDGDDILDSYKNRKPVSKSLEEIIAGKLKYEKKSKNTLK